MSPKSKVQKPTIAQTSKSKQKPAAKKQLSPKEKSKRLFRSLCAQIDGGHFKNALKTCDKILRIDAKDPDALQTKLFLLLQTEQYDMALTLIKSLSDPAARKFEETYALYRLHRESEAAELLVDLKSSLGSDDFYDRGVMHLEAQLAYRQCAYLDAFDHYTQLLDSSSADSDEHADLITNLNASQSHLDFLTTGYLHALDALPTTVTNHLETAAPPAPPSIGNTAPLNATMATTLPQTGGSSNPTTAKKVRMSRVPKGVVPGVTPPPDPERWIKKSERSTFGQNMGRRRKTAGGGATQGSSNVAENTNSATSSHSAKTGGGKNRKKK